MRSIDLGTMLVSAFVFYWLILEVEEAMYMEKIERMFNPTKEDFQIKFLSNGHIYMGCPADGERRKALEDLANESPYVRGYYAYWKGLESNEVSALQYQGWCDARDEVEKGAPSEISSR